MRLRGLIHRIKSYAEQLTKRRILIVPKGHIHGMRFTDDLERQGHQVSCAFDVGAHRGETAQVIAEAFPLATIYCFEPVQENFRALEHAVARLRVKCFPLALGSAQTRGTIYLDEASTAHSLATKSGRTRTQEVEITTLDAFCGEHQIGRIDLLKIDTEGYDLEVLKGARQLLNDGRVGYVMAEVALDPRDKYFVSFEAIRDHLSQFNYRVFGVYDQSLDWGAHRHLHFANAMFVHASAPWRTHGEKK